MPNTMVPHPFVYITPHRICNTFTFLQFGVHHGSAPVRNWFKCFRIDPEFQNRSKFQNLYRISECRFEFQKTVFVSESCLKFQNAVLLSECRFEFQNRVSVSEDRFCFRIALAPVGHRTNTTNGCPSFVKRQKAESFFWLDALNQDPTGVWGLHCQTPVIGLRSSTGPLFIKFVNPLLALLCLVACWCSDLVNLVVAMDVSILTRLVRINRLLEKNLHLENYIYHLRELNSLNRT